MKNVFVLLTICSFVLSGCSPIEPTAVTPQPALDPTSTLLPTATKPKPAPTLNPNEIAAKVFSDLTIEIQILHSPNGRCTWDRLLAHSIEEPAVKKYNNQFYMRVSVACVLGDAYKEVNWLPVDEWTGQGLGYSIPALLGWSADDERMYFFDQIIPDGCQPIGGWQENYRQLDLETGNITLLFPELRSGASLSHDTTRLVYFDMQNKDVGVYTFASGEVQHYPFSIPEQTDYWDVGEFTWSPDGQSVLFVMVYGDSCNPSGASIQKLDIARGEIRLKWVSTVKQPPLLSGSIRCGS